MKKSVYLPIIFFTLTLVISSCYLQSVHPLVHHRDSELVEGLEGVWEGEDSKWYFINDPNNFRIFMGSDDRPYEDDGPMSSSTSYYVFFETIQEGVRDTSQFIGSTININGNHYLDLYHIRKESFEDYQFKDHHYFPVHTFSKISIGDNKLKIELFEDKWLKEQIVNNRLRIKHEKIGELGQGVLVTASTEELQQFVLKYGNIMEAYEDPLLLNRIQ